MLCAAGLARMEDLLALDGPWDSELIATMIPVAVEIEIGRVEVIFRGVYGAIAASFSKDGMRAVEAEKEGLLANVRRAMRINRGLDPNDGPEGRADTDADHFMASMGKMGLGPGKGHRVRRSTREKRRPSGVAASHPGRG